MLHAPSAVVFFVDDVQGARQWYRAVLGVEPYRVEPAFVGFRVGAFELGLHSADPPSAAAERGRGAVCYFAVVELADALARLTAHGATVLRAPIALPEGGRACQVRDPFGNVFGLREPAGAGATSVSRAAADEAEAIWRAVVASNAAWTRGEPRGVADLYAEDAVMVAPDLAATVRGREAIVQSYVEYCAVARTLDFRTLAHQVELGHETAVVAYRFAVRYELAGQTHDELGEEVLVFARRGGRWTAIWRTQIPFPPPV